MALGPAAKTSGATRVVAKTKRLDTAESEELKDVAIELIGLYKKVGTTGLGRTSWTDTSFPMWGNANYCTVVLKGIA